MIVAGLTGSIAMGKSTVAGMFAEFGVPTFDADDAVRDFYAGDGAKAVEAAFPGVMVSGQVDRERLGSLVLGHAEALQRLEGLVHPAVAEARLQFLSARRLRAVGSSSSTCRCCSRPAGKRMLIWSSWSAPRRPSSARALWRARA